MTISIANTLLSLWPQMKSHLAMHSETMNHFESKKKFLGKVCLHHIVQGPAEIPDDMETQLIVELLACGICP
jgi:hypothetical protein